MTLEVTDQLGASVDPIGDDDGQAQLRRMLRELIVRESPSERVRELDDREAFDHALRDRLATVGVFGLGAPEAHGGAGGVVEQLIAVEELAFGPTSMAVHVIVQYMGVQILSGPGTTDRHHSALEALIAGDDLIAFALSESGGGTDVARAMRTRAVREGEHWRISGEKMWISGADIADHLLLLARTSDLDTDGIEGITMFLVPTSTEGVEIHLLDTVGVHSLGTCALRLDDVVVPTDAAIGEVDRGFRQVLATLNRERLNTAAGAVGAGRGALEAALAYARDREAFGKPIGAFQALQHRLVDGAIALESARGLMIRAARIEEAGGRADLLSSMAKVAASEAAVAITQDGMQLMGGFGFSREFPMQRWFRDVRLWTFSPLTNEMVRNYLA